MRTICLPGRNLFSFYIFLLKSFAASRSFNKVTIFFKIGKDTSRMDPEVRKSSTDFAESISSSQVTAYAGSQDPDQTSLLKFTLQMRKLTGWETYQIQVVPFLLRWSIQSWCWLCIRCSFWQCSKMIQNCIFKKSHKIAGRGMSTNGRILRLNIDLCSCSTLWWASFWKKCVFVAMEILKYSLTSTFNWRNCVGLNRSRNKVVPNSIIVARGHVWITAAKRFHCDWGSVSQTTCRVFRSNTARRVRVFQCNSFIKIVDSAKRMLTCDSDLLRFNGDVEGDSLPEFSHVGQKSRCFHELSV